MLARTTPSLPATSLCICAAVGGPVASLTAKSVTATFLGTAGGDDWAVEMWGAALTAGSGDVVVNLTGTSFGSTMAYGVLANSSNVPFGTPGKLASPTTFTASQGTTTGLTLSAGDLRACGQLDPE